MKEMFSREEIQAMAYLTVNTKNGNPYDLAPDTAIHIDKTFSEIMKYSGPIQLVFHMFGEGAEVVATKVAMDRQDGYIVFIVQAGDFTYLVSFVNGRDADEHTLTVANNFQFQFA